MVRILLSGLALLVPLAAAADEVRIGKRDCQRLVRHIPDADVAYQPGVDVRGNKVAPADLNGGNRIDLPDAISFDLSIDLADKYGHEALGEATIGRVTVKGDRVYWNGRPLDEGASAEVLAACKRAYGGR